MRYTPNYNMVIGEGTDAVNPLTQIFPNFETIDTAMENNKNGGITTASEVTTGGVHAIVRVNTSSPVFRFTATSAWTTGDTMTLDGSAVTVHLTDGTAPKSGAYVIGAEVVGIVNGSLVTLLAGASFDGVLSFNSRQGVVTPQSGDYTANQIGYNNTVSGLTATDTQAAIDELQSEIQNVPAGGVNYSTTEHEIGTWIDGSTLYEKTINFGAMPNNTSRYVPHGITNLKEIVSVEATAIRSDRTFPIPNSGTNSNEFNYGIRVFVDYTQGAYISTGMAWNDTNAYITVRYTKTA